MNKRFILILLLVLVSIAIAVVAVWHQRTYPFSFWTSRSVRLAAAQLDTGRLAEFGLVEKITPTEFQDATNILVQERRMWSKFKGMSAGINIEFEGNDGKRLSLEGDASLRRVDLSPIQRKEFIAKYEMTISNAQGGWTVTTDGTSNNTVITCSDPQLSETIKTIGPASILHMLTSPQYVSAVLYRDELYPEDLVNPYTLNQFLQKWEPWLTTNSTPHSYTFFGMGSDDRYGRHEITFKNGHISRWRKTEAKPGNPVVEVLAIHFENPVESNGFWYPTVIRITPAPTPWPYPGMEEGWFVSIDFPYPAKGKGQLCITLSDVSVSIK